MIFKLLIVDDEATMRKGIANFMNWSSIECEVAGTACDGVEAIEFLRKSPVDIVITDIRMPEADGLEVARYVYEKRMDTRVILLTGYADFEYAQTAIRYNVSSFLLKPTNKKALFEAVQEAQKVLIESKRKSSVAKEELAFLKDQALQELTDQELTPKLEERLLRLGLKLDYYYVAAFQLIPMSEDITALKRIIMDEQQNAHCYRYGNLIITVYFQDHFSSGIPDEILTNCREITAISQTFASWRAAAGISRCHHAPQEFGVSVSESIMALTHNFYSEENVSVFSVRESAQRCDITAENSMDLYRFENGLHAYQFDDARIVIESMFLKFRSNFVNSRDVKNICAQLYFICSRVLIKKESDPPRTEYLSRIERSADIFALEEAAKEVLAYTTETLLALLGCQNKLTDSAIKYICSNLEEPLSLELIARKLHISPSHLSRTFKKSLKESLTEYINRARIEKAREYLQKTDILTYEVAELVGYHDPAYFSSIFKKYTGVSPTEYRQGRKKE